jgi:hypothetical protein
MSRLLWLTPLFVAAARARAQDLAADGEPVQDPVQSELERLRQRVDALGSQQQARPDAAPRQSLALSGGRVVEAHIALAETSRSFAHNNKYGKPYTGKSR